MRRPISFVRVVVAVVLCKLALLFPLAAVAAPATTESELVVPLTINTVDQGETPILLAGDDIFVPVMALEKASLAGVSWQRVATVARLRGSERSIAGQSAISLKSLAPWVTYAFDEGNLTLAVLIDPTLIGTQQMAVAPSKPVDMIYSNDSSAFANYALNSFGSQVAAFGELGASIRRSLLYTAFSRSPDNGFVRGLTNLTFDEPSKLRRWIAGDATVRSDELGGFGFLGGVTLTRSFELDPYYVRYPALNLRGLATTPSTVEVYVNGMLVSRQTIAPGPFDIHDVPATAGSSTAQVIIRDVFGRAQTTSSSFYYSTAVLGRGISDYIYSIGYQRDALATRSFDYSDPVGVASYRYGITQRVTLGGRAEAGQGFFSGGPSFAFASRIGELDLKTAASSRDGQHGNAASLSVRRIARRGSVAASVRLMSRGYSNFSLPPSRDRALSDVGVFASYAPRWGNLGIQVNSLKNRDLTDQKRLTLMGSVPISQRLDLTVSGAITEDGLGHRTNEYFAGLNFRLGMVTNVNIGAASRDDHVSAIVDLQKTLPLGEGFGYHLQSATSEGQNSGQAGVQYQNRYGRYEVSTGLQGRSTNASVAGGVIYGGGRVMATRAVEQSFALVRVPEIANVRVYLSNQLIGRTDSNGDLLIPLLLPYYGNRIRIDDRDIPMEYDVQVVEKTIAPPTRGGAVVEFGVRGVRTVIGNVSLPAGGASVGYGQLTLSSGDNSHVSPVGASGDFYFENLTPGQYPALLEYETGSCSFTLTIPDAAKGSNTTDLGPVICSGTKP